jgi:hypothetical protein
MTWGLLGVAAAAVWLVAVLVRGPKWYRHWLLVSIAAVVATGLIGLGLVVLLADEPYGRSCAGTGVLTDTSGPTPEEALAAYVVSVGGDPADWERGGLFGDESFEPVSGAARPDVDVLLVDETEPGTWQVTENCVEAFTVEGDRLVPVP